jgi:hypothetical protein
VRETVEAVARLRPKYADGVPQSALVEVLGLDKSAVSRRVDASIEAGYIYNDEVRKGVPARLMVGDRLPEEQEVLPEPEILAAAVDRCTVAAPMEDIGVGSLRFSNLQPMSELTM